MASIPSKVKAELLPAFLWICPSCGLDNFERTIVVELSSEEISELREDHGVETWETGQFLTSPGHVNCSHCNESFVTEEYESESNIESGVDEAIGELDSQIVFGMEGKARFSEEQFARIVDHWNRLNPRRMLTEQEAIAISHGSQLW